jgi:ABC-type nitrate/sulfonate/bicarbonate transport system permease component
MKWYFSYIGPLIIIIIWVIVSGHQIVSPILLPTPWAVLKSFFEIIAGKNQNILFDIGLTCYRTLFSFIFSCVIGVPIGLLMGYNIKIFRTFEFTVDFFRSIPPIALFPLFILLLGIGEAAKLGVPVYGCTLVIIVNSIYGVLNSPKLRRVIGQVYGFSKSRIFWKIVFPDSMPQVFSGMRIALSLALVLTIVVEMTIGSNNGLGKKIYDFHLMFDTSQMYAAILITGIIGYLLNKGFILIERRIIHWRDK